ncbi:MAG TPA: arginine--tRNA ligase [Candidatus Paceibacterota bacterium]|nr:arginine--tRNA ligase [Candidatus Paceibacterota bacterium]HOX90851.1 arginine--tRNA ligase [Candidatus Paceibacterota bacterium]HPC12368.1 arginine--tRNA ligase [Candidatus Paceibacterota bacterium]HPI66871.1 arginine--tRNA ligase [Candidatus Paceibacterota bacterium]HQC46002.1 arginine--tRNA ligase [Candidatus Paceibacterota bacterium]
MKKEIEEIIKSALTNLGLSQDVVFTVEHPEDIKHGDYSSNVALIYSKEVGKNPRDLGQQIKDEIEKEKFLNIAKIEIAGAGFINFYLTKEFFTQKINQILEEGNNWGKNKILEGKKVMIEYTDPNPFKPFHIGHLMANAVGESISRIIEYSGADTIRANYQGDLGLHVAKAIYGLKEYGLPEESKSVSDKAIYIGQCYSKASNLYDDDPRVKNEIDLLNKKIYEQDKEIKDIYDWGRKITLEAFQAIYKFLDTNFDYYFFESEMVSIGTEIVKDNMEKIFEESNGAIIFDGQKYDSKLHTRVFINSQGIPTYEAKELGLTLTKFEKENLDLSIVTTAIEQAEYMKVVQKAISLIYPEIEKKMKHITHGMMKLVSGKMSSRKGNIITGEALINDSVSVVLEKIKDRDFKEDDRKDISEKVGLSALRYSILKSHLGADIIYDFDKSISFDGDSGPYLQYTAVRANSILEKSKTFDLAKRKNTRREVSFLEKTLYQFPEIVEKSYINLEPHHIVKYLTELAGSFNVFYGQTKILAEENDCMEYDLKIVKSFYQTMKNGLYLLGIKIPDKM